MADYNTTFIQEQLKRTLERAMLDFTTAADGKTPLGIIMHVQWVDGAMASAEMPKTTHPKQAMILLDEMGRQISAYISKIKAKINTVVKQTEQ